MLCGHLCCPEGDFAHDLGCLDSVLSLSKALSVLPRPTRASLPTLPSQVYDVPVQRQVSSTLEVSFTLQPCPGLRLGAISMLFAFAASFILKVDSLKISCRCSFG